MTNNDVLRRLRYVFDYKEKDLVELFKQADEDIHQELISLWLKKDDDPKYKSLPDVKLAALLNGLIIQKRGKKDGPQMEPEQSLSNNLILRKFKIALNLTSDGMLDILLLANFRLGKSELSAFFRKPDHKHYRECKDQVLRNFLQGLQIKYRPQKD